MIQTIIIKKFGADTARLFMISDSPPERDLEWSIEGIKATYKYLKKFLTFYKNDFTFVLQISDKEIKNFSEEETKIFKISQKQYLNTPMILKIIDLILLLQN